jgi:hypothetical protein
MSRKMSVFAVAVALVITPLVFAADGAKTKDPDCADETASAVVATPEEARSAALAAMFAVTAEDEVIETLDGIASGMGALEVVVARVDADGKIVLACVDNEKAAERFLTRPLDKLATKEEKEH